MNIISSLIGVAGIAGLITLAVSKGVVSGGIDILFVAVPLVVGVAAGFLLALWEKRKQLAVDATGN